jgi:23S rRNA (adenine2503-C2)-methyltransferase
VDYQRPDQKRIKAFKTILEQEKVGVTVRYSRGLAANAACGQL